MTLSYPKVMDANGAPIDLQGIQKVRTYSMDAIARTVTVLATDGSAISAPRGFWADKAGTATIVDASGNTITGFPINAGFNPIAITGISSLVTTTKIWGLY